MIGVGELTAKQEEVLDLTVEAVKRAESLIRPGVMFSELHEAAFSVYLERGYMRDSATRTMPFNWEAMPDGKPRRLKRQHVPDEDWECQGRRLEHVYPAQAGPHNPNLGHAVGMPKMPLFNISSHNCDKMEEGMVFVLHAQWLDPLVAGSNVGNCYLVTADGCENLTRHTPLEPLRVRAPGATS